MLERNPEEAAVPIVVHTEAVEAVHMEVEVVHTEAAGAVRAVHTEAAGVVQAVHMEVEVVHTEAAVPNLAVAVGLDHKTWINPSRQIFINSLYTIQENRQYHTTGVEANRQASISVCQEQALIGQASAPQVISPRCCV